MDDEAVLGRLEGLDQVLDPLAEVYVLLAAYRHQLERLPAGAAVPPLPLGLADALAVAHQAVDDICARLGGGPVLLH
ncbi:MAG: hypothetical protein ACTHMJ_18640 [Thermomicrobiales bacterium]